MMKRSSLAVACMTGLYGAPALAATDLIGTVTNKDKSVNIEGALAEIEQLNIKRVTSRDGTFRFNGLEAGQYTIKITYLGAEPASFPLTVSEDGVMQMAFPLTAADERIEEVLVYGQRASQATALNRQKNANRVTSIVSADAIGQFPDQNVAESLQRLPGLSIQRDQGEGRFVSIRGIDPNLNNLSINGVNVPSPESGVRSVAMDVIPSELVASLEVSKTVTPDMDADAIGGSVNVKSLSAFDRADGAYSVTMQGSYADLRDETSPKLSGSYSTIFNVSDDYKLGLAAAASWFERSFGSDNVETDGGWGSFDAEDAATGDDVEIFGAEEIEQRAYWIARERAGLALNFDLKGENSSYYLRTLYSEFSDDEYRLRNEYKFSDGKLLSATDSSASFTDAEMDRDTKDRYEEQSILSMVVGGETYLDAWKLEFSAGYSKSDESEPDRLDADFKGEGLDIAYLTSGRTPQFTQGAEAHDLANFELDEIVFEDNVTEDEEVSARFDLTREFVWNNNNAAFKFGGKVRQREKTNTLTAIVYDGGFDNATGADFADDTPDWGLGNFGPGISRSAMKNFFNANRANFDLNRIDSEIDSKGGSFESSEDIWAAYAMLDIDIDKWNIVAGVRYESTDFDTSGNRVELIVDEVADEERVEISPWDISKSYDHFLPSLNIRYDASEKIIARFAYTQTIARPTFGDSAAFQIIESETTEDDGEIVTERKAEVGNPDLDPYESNNLDLSIEYYPGNIGVLSAGLFYKDITNYIVQQEVQDNGQWDGFEEVIQPVNGGNAELTGIELAWTKSFENGLLIVANATFTDSDEELPNQSDTVGNIAVGYETNSLSTRLSLSHKSKSFQFEDQDAPVYEDAHNQLDFNVKYYINDKLHVYFNGVNLTDEPLYLYHQTNNYNYQYEEYGRTFELGLTWSTF